MKIIPAIDILDNKVVRLKKGDYNSSVEYNDSPLNQALVFAEYGFDYLHIVDLTGAKNKENNISEIIRSITDKGIKVQVGGGIKSVAAAKKLVDSGAEKIILGSVAVLNEEEALNIINTVGSGRIIIGADVINEYIAINAWQNISAVSISDHIYKYTEYGIKDYLITDVDKDGMLNGVNENLYELIKRKYSGINIYVSGGISSAEDIKKLKNKGYYAVIVGKAYYEGKIKPEELISC